MVKTKVCMYVSLGCLLSTPCARVYALTQNQLKYICGLASTGAVAAVAWAYAERTNKQTLKIKVDKLAKELAFIKSDQVKVQQDQEFLAVLAQMLKRIEQEYAQELALFRQQSSYSEHEIAQLMRILQARIQIKTSSAKQLKVNVQRELQEIVALSQRLALKKTEWGRDNRAHAYEEQAHKLIERMSNLELFLQALHVTLENYSNILDLAVILTHDYQTLYAIELKLQELEDKELYRHELDQHIRARYSEAFYQFPYLAYAEYLKKDMATLKQAVEHARAGFNTPFLAELESKAVPMLEFLENLLKFVVTTPVYTKEKAYKPEFDRQEAQVKAELQEKQERLTAELRESQARIERERKLVEAQLQAEKNRAQELANKKVELDLERKSLEVKDHQLSFELARIRDGETIKEALRQNNNDWHYKYSSLQATNLRFKDQLERVHAENNRELDKLRIEINSLKNNLKTSETQIHKLTQQSRELHEKIDRSIDTLRQLEGYNPPFNPEIVDGLNNYIKNIKSYARAARNALS